MAVVHSEEAGLEVYSTLKIEDAVDFERFADYINEESCGAELDWDEVNEYLSNLY